MSFVRKIRRCLSWKQKLLNCMLSCRRYRTIHSWPNAQQPAVPYYVWTMDRFRGQHRQCRTHTWAWVVRRWWINCRVCQCLPQRHRPHRHKTQLVNRLASSCHSSSRNNSQMVIWKHRQVSIQMPPPTRPRMMSDRNDNHNVNKYITLEWRATASEWRMGKKLTNTTTYTKIAEGSPASHTQLSVRLLQFFSKSLNYTNCKGLHWNCLNSLIFKSIVIFFFVLTKDKITNIRNIICMIIHWFNQF